MEQFTSLSETLQEAAMALRRLVPAVAQQQRSVSSTTASVSSTAGAPLGSGVVVGAPSASGQFEDAWATDDMIVSGRVTPSLPGPSVLLGSQISPVSGGPSALWERSNISSDPMSDVRRILLENATLREACHDANCRIVQLEDEKMHFFDEGIFDLVNNVCGQNGGSGVSKPTLVDLSAGDHAVPLAPPPCRSGGRCGAHAPGGSPMAGAESHQLSLTPRRAGLGSTVAGAVAAASDGTPAAYSAEAEWRRRREELRSLELRQQNEALRRELARAGEVGEALEFQQQLAEERMLELEQEQQWLRERMANLAAMAVSPTPIRAPGAPSFNLPTSGPDGSPGVGELQPRAAASPQPLRAATQPQAGGSPLLQRQAAARAAADELEEVNRRLRCELDEASCRYDRLLQVTEEAERKNGGASSVAQEEALQAETRLETLREEAAEAAARAEAAASREHQLRAENEALEAERRRVEEQQASRERIIGDLDTQTQALERRLRESEARSRQLEEENAQLRQATVPSATLEQGMLGADDCVPPGAIIPEGTEVGIDDSFAKALEDAW